MYVAFEYTFKENRLYGNYKQEKDSISKTDSCCHTGENTILTKQKGENIKRS